MVLSGDQLHRWLIHDRDSIYSEGVDASLASMGLTILKTASYNHGRPHASLGPGVPDPQGEKIGEACAERAAS